ncbi:MAG: ATP-binding cassette domain-containing protein [Pseudomonadota bacterium]
MLQLKNVAIARGSNLLFETGRFNVYEKNTIGVVGANGCGKSSLFAAITDQLECAKGEITIKNGTRICSLSQEIPGLDDTALHYVISSNKKLANLFDKLAHAEKTEDYETVANCHIQLADLDGYSTQAKAAKILHGLGFSSDDFERPVAHFSGGWRVRLNLAQCLFAPSDLLLLDEPTNHLDMEAIMWLENFLTDYTGAILLISHDRDFLDNTVTAIAHIEHRRMKIYTGNYSSFELQRAARIIRQNDQYKKQQQQIAHMMKFVDRFRYKPSKAKQAQSRLKMIERMRLVEPIREQSPFRFSFYPPEKMSSPMVVMNKVNLGYDDNTVLYNINLTIVANARLGLLGINGAGKSTLIKAICGKLPPLSGDITRAASTKIAYFAQHQVDELPIHQSPLSLFYEQNQSAREKELIDYLGSFGFSRDQSLSSIQHFSGGEKSRLALALIIRKKPNLLLLDEPSNHLDLDMREALTFALQDYSGALLVVAHDRHLLRTLVDEFYLIRNGNCKPFTGSIEDYWQNVNQA